MPFSFREWYELNGKRLNEKRKQRYHEDTAYRERVLKTNQESRKKQRDTSDETPSEKRVVRPRSDEKRFKTVDAEVDGVRERLFTIGALAQALGCSIQAIRLWERQGYIPATPIRSGKGKNGDRLYTQEMVEEFRRILTAQGRLSGSRGGAASPKLRGLKRYIRLADGRVKETQLFLIGALAEAVSRNVVTLEQLETKGFLPRTPFLASSVKRRLYTAEMISAVKAAFEDRGGDIRGEDAWKAFHDDVLERWTALGVVGAALVQAAPPTKEHAANGREEGSYSQG